MGASVGDLFSLGGAYSALLRAARRPLLNPVRDVVDHVETGVDGRPLAG